jgi:hypothetical protein
MNDYESITVVGPACNPFFFMTYDIIINAPHVFVFRVIRHYKLFENFNMLMDLMAIIND